MLKHKNIHIVYRLLIYNQVGKNSSASYKKSTNHQRMSKTAPIHSCPQRISIQGFCGFLPPLPNPIPANLAAGTWKVHPGVTGLLHVARAGCEGETGWEQRTLCWAVAQGSESPRLYHWSTLLPQVKPAWAPLHSRAPGKTQSRCF